MKGLDCVEQLPHNEAYRLVEHVPRTSEQHMKDRTIRIIPIRRKQPDLKLLAQALIALVEEQRQKEQETKPKPKGGQRAS